MGRGANGVRGLVVEMNHRRKSGRSVEEMFFLPSPSLSSNEKEKEKEKEKIILLDDHLLFRCQDHLGDEDGESALGELSTFDLGITDRQRRDREGVVLPYFDAQKDGFGAGGVGDGGRILYEMGVEDDFDEEEDEI